MHRDMKVGLALAILLIGVVAAFFFRNDSDTADALPQITNSDELDRQIADKEMTPYLTDANFLETSTPIKRATDETSPPDTTSDPFDISTPDSLKESESERNAMSSELLPEPIKATRPATEPHSDSDAIVSKHLAQKPVNRHPESEPDTNVSFLNQRRANVPRHNAAWEAVGTPSNGAHPTSHFITHRVTKGETLSGLAQTYLGSSNRFLEIFQMNRDMLRNPNDLKVGMEIKIPRTVPISRPSSPSDASTGPSAQRARQTPERETPDSRERPSRQFTPMRRAPFRPKTQLAPAASLDALEKTVR